MLRLGSEAVASQGHSCIRLEAGWASISEEGPGASIGRGLLISAPVLKTCAFDFSSERERERACVCVRA